jgi:uncharacterized protein involved in exopolysaccharide biosynthesis
VVKLLEGSEKISVKSRELPTIYLAVVLLRQRHLIAVFGGLGALIALLYAAWQPKQYTSTATFVPQNSDASASGLALAASQFGIKIAAGQPGGWSSAIYVELLSSATIRRRIASDTVTIAEEGNRKSSLIDLLAVKGNKPNERAERSLRFMNRLVSVVEDKKLGGVRLAVTTKWPSVSYQLATRFVRDVGDFNNTSRKTQVTEERKFVEQQAANAERSLRAAEGRLQMFLQTNRAYMSSPSLVFEHDRLQRDVSLWQQIYTTLAQNREDARIREVRDVPVVTMLESPRVPALPNTRGTALATVLGGVFGAFVAVLLALLADAMKRTESVPPSEEVQTLLAMARAMTPASVRALIWRGVAAVSGPER